MSIISFENYISADVTMEDGPRPNVTSIFKFNQDLCWLSIKDKISTPKPLT